MIRWHKIVFWSLLISVPACIALVWMLHAYRLRVDPPSALGQMSLALALYAGDHQGQIPSNLQDPTWLGYIHGETRTYVQQNCELLAQGEALASVGADRVIAFDRASASPDGVYVILGDGRVVWVHGRNADVLGTAVKTGQSATWMAGDVVLLGKRAPVP